jgi:1-acyl-sn-glycerol-3-phosphate acyltransferase
MSIAELPVTKDKRTPIIQPVSVVYDRLSGLPLGRAARPIFAWYGDMDLASHFWRLTQHENFRASVLLHQPIDPERFASRKELSAACWKIVADGASTLRQNRPVVPGVIPGSSEVSEINPAFV